MGIYTLDMQAALNTVETYSEMCPVDQKQYLTALTSFINKAAALLKREADHVQSHGSQHLATHADKFFSPFLAKLDSAKVMATAAARTEGQDNSKIIQHICAVFRNADSHIIGRLKSDLDASDLNTLEGMLHNHKVTESEVNEARIPMPAKPKYSLLKVANEVSTAYSAGVPGVEATQDEMADLKILPVVKKAIKDRLDALNVELQKEITMSGKTDYAVKVPFDEFPSPNRIRRGLDGAIGLMEWLSQALSGDKISYHDLRLVVIHLNTFGNVMSQHIPPEVIKFLYTAGKWKQWEISSDEKFGKRLEGSDEVTGFRNEKPMGLKI